MDTALTPTLPTHKVRQLVSIFSLWRFPLVFRPRGIRHSIVPPALMVLILALLLQGCAAHTSPSVEPPVAAPEQEKTATDTVEEALISEDAFAEDDEFLDDDDFFDDEGLIDEFGDTPEELVWDPLAPFNRAMFTLNDTLLIWVVKPVASGYRTVTPTIVRRGVANFFNNLKAPVRLISSLLQGKLKGAGSEVGRFVINTTVGVLGFGDPAGSWFHMEPSDEDLGQVLGAWGVGNGMYIVWPILGPSTLRDSASIPGYFYLNPVGYVEPTKLSLAITAYEQLNEASFSMDDYIALKASALDPYSFIRDLYIQSREKMVQE